MSSGDLNRPDTPGDEDIRRQLADGYSAPPPAVEFVGSLGSQLGQELRPASQNHLAENSPSAKMVFALLAGLAASVLIVVLSFGAGVWMIARGFSEPDSVGPEHETVQEQSREEALGAAASQATPDERSSAQPPNATPSPDVPASSPARGQQADPTAPRRSVAVADGASGGVATAPEANQGSKPLVSARLRYGWRPGQKYAYEYSLEGDLGDSKQRTRGSITYEVKDPSGRRVTTPRRQTATGSGFVVSSDGYLISCAHVVKGSTSVKATMAGNEYEVDVIALDKRKDLALLRVHESGLTPLPLGDSGTVELAQDVRVVGYPLTDVLGASIKITRGTVAGIVDKDNEKLFQVDAAINAGNSGGPLVNSRGEVIGVASAKLSGEEISNVGFAVPAAAVADLLRANGVSPRRKSGTAPLEGPELARRVTPSVALLKVTIGPGGVGVEEQIQLSYAARMSSSQPSSSRSRPGRFSPFRGPMGPRFMGPSRTNSPETERGKCLVDIAGEIYESDVELHLPFLMGPVAHLVIEPLPDEDETSWYRQRSISIIHTEREESASPFPGSPFTRHHPFGPFGRSQKPREKVVNVTTAFERYDYQLGEANDDTFTIKKRYELETVDEDADPHLKVTGAGSVVFGRAEGVPRSTDFEGTFEVTTEQMTRRIPFTFTYQQVDPAADPTPTAGGLKTTPSKPKSAEKKEPLTTAQIDGVLEKLKSTDRWALQRVLNQLAGETPGERRSEVSRAIELQLAHQDGFVRQAAAKALQRWGGEENVTAFIRATQDTAFPVRHAAIAAIGNHPSKQAAEAVVRVYGKNKMQAKPALIKMGPIAEDAVLSLLAHEDWPVQMDACQILAKIGTQKSLTPLRETAARTKLSVHHNANQAVQEIQQRIATAAPATKPDDGSTTPAPQPVSEGPTLPDERSLRSSPADSSASPGQVRAEERR